MNIEKKCTIAEIIYRNTENGYTIAVAENETEQLTIVGTLPTCDKGRMFVLRGNFTNHPKYGEQFAFTEWSEEMPSSEAGIQAFLASGVLKGIGPKAAKAIVDRFGTDTFRIIEEEPGRLTDVSGIGEVKAASIAEAFAAHREVAEVTLYFQQFDIKPETVLKLYRVYGSDTIRLVQENPYRLMEEVYSIGFRKADQIAEKLGIKRDDEARIQSGIRYTLWYHVNEGHTFLPQKELIEKAGELLEVESHRIHDTMVSMVLEGDLRMEELEGRNVVFLFPYYTAETYVAHGLKNLNEADLKPIYANVEELIGISQQETGIAYSAQQKIAIRTSMLQTGCALGGEQSGHIIFLAHSTTGDGILSSLQVMRAIGLSGRKASELSDDITIYPQVLVNATVKNENKEKYLKDPTIAGEIKAIEKAMNGNGRVLIRPSGTEPLVRVMEASEILRVIRELS